MDDQPDPLPDINELSSALAEWCDATHKTKYADDDEWYLHKLLSEAYKKVETVSEIIKGR